MKYHKHCCGRVKYQKSLEEGCGFDQAGFCLKCEAFPIVEGDIIFEVKDGFEGFNESKKEWIITEDLEVWRE